MSDTKPTPEERIRELAKKSNIGAADAARLLAAVKTEPVPAGRKFDPFTRLDATVGTVIGVVISALAVVVSHLGVRFDGALDLHTSAGVTWQKATTDQIAAFLIPAAILWLVGYAFARRGRPIDMLSTVGVARVPQVVFSIPVAVIGTGGPNAHSLSPLGWLLVGLVLVGTAFQIYLLVIGFRTATGLSGSRLAYGIVGGLIACEVASKIFLSLV